MTQQALLIPERTLPVPAFVPGSVRAELAGRRVVIERLPVAVRRRMVTPQRLRVSEHAASYRKVTDGAHVGAWRHEYAPHTVKIMDTWMLPHVREVWFCASEQDGKTAAMTNCLHWSVDCDPGDIFYLMASENTAQRVMGKKILPMIRASERLRRYQTGRADDLGLSQVRFNHGVTIWPAWANSPASMASFPAKYLFGDEVDKYPAQAGKEASPVVLLRKRGRLFRGASKAFFASSPGEARIIFSGTMGCHQVYQWALACPHCQELVRPTGEQFEGIIDPKADPESITAEQARLACPSCGAHWDELDRETAIRTGRWLCVKGTEVARPRTVGFWRRGWDCPDISLVELAVAWLRAQQGGVAEKVAWANGYECTDYDAERKDRQEEVILALVDEHRPKTVVPDEACCLIALADTQRIGFYYQVWALGWGPDVPVWMIDHNFVERFDHLVDLGAREWHTADGTAHRIVTGLLDSGGGTQPDRPKHSRTVEVYDFCRLNPLWRPIKGRRTMAGNWTATRLDYYPNRMGKKIPIPGGLVLYILNVTVYKNELARRLQAGLGAPGCITLHAATGLDYAKQLCSEYQDERGYWQCPRGKANHHWDIGVYGMAAIDILGLRNKRKPTGETPPARRILSRGVRL